MIVIADDITGAAEIAGIAKTAGLRTRLEMVSDVADIQDFGVSRLRSFEESGERDYDVLVFATDTRQMVEDEAVAVVEAIAEVCCGEAIFKKTDSVLRGHVLAECKAVLRKTDYEQVLLVPQNPSKGRVVRGGMYYINNVPLDKTQFAHDPEFPATTAEVSLYGVPDAESEEDIRRLVEKVDSKTLLAGGADLFKAQAPLNPPCRGNLAARGSLLGGEVSRRPLSGEEVPLQGGFRGAGGFLMVCGSTQSKSVVDAPLCRRYGAEECNMPEEVFMGKAGCEVWLKEIGKVFPKRGAVLTINYPSQGGKDFAVRLRKTMGETVRRIVEERIRDFEISRDRGFGKLALIIEGGATAFEILAQLGWTSFAVSREHFPGVVELENEYAKVILKPGSYPWKGLLDNENCFN